MKLTLVIYLNTKKARKALKQRSGFRNVWEALRFEASSLNEIAALEAAEPRKGEVVLNSVSLIKE